MVNTSLLTLVQIFKCKIETWDAHGGSRCPGTDMRHSIHSFNPTIYWNEMNDINVKLKSICYFFRGDEFVKTDKGHYLFL